jgi:hypothetical protein
MFFLVSSSPTVTYKVSKHWAKNCQGQDRTGQDFWFVLLVDGAKLGRGGCVGSEAMDHGFHWSWDMG